VTPQPAGIGAAVGGQRVIGREERVEYRDQEGNLLDVAQVSALEAEGKVSFKTKYETRTRLVDEDGNEVPGSDGVAPEHPDVEGVDRDTKGVKGEVKSAPAEAMVERKGSVSREGTEGEARPASDASEATK